MKKRLSALLVLMATAVMLTGCCISHDWEDATCEQPETCSKCGKERGEKIDHDWEEATCKKPQTCSVCGETEGEKLDHKWKDATCTEPQTCKRCGKTKGEPLGHQVEEATYWEAGKCTVCGEPAGDKLEADFEKYGLDKQIIGLNETVPYTTVCYDNTSRSTVGRLTITGYEEMDEVNGIPAKDGYVWKVVTSNIVFDDDNAWNYGMSVGVCNEDYYDIKGHDDSANHGSDLSTYIAHTPDGDKEIYMITNSSFTDWVNKSCTYNHVSYFMIPENCDAMVVGFFDRSTEWKDGMYINDVADENAVFFRLD